MSNRITVSCLCGRCSDAPGGGERMQFADGP
jgi:hypothetical protein